MRVRKRSGSATGVARDAGLDPTGRRNAARKRTPRSLSPPFDSARDGAAGKGMAFDYDFLMRIGSPRPTVFERLLRIEHLSRWFCGWSRIEPKVGGSFKFGGETCLLPPEGRSWETTLDHGEVLRRFTFRWPIRGVETRVAYDLDDGPGGTAVLRAPHH